MRIIRAGLQRTGVGVTDLALLPMPPGWFQRPLELAVPQASLPFRPTF